MKKKKGFLILGMGMMLLLAGASVLYNYLGDKVQTGNLLASDVEEEKSVDEVSDTGDLKDEISEDVLMENTSKEDISKEESTEKEDAIENKPVLKPAQDFIVTDLEGNEVSLSDFKGKPVVLNFWASWCGICKNEMMDFEIIYNQYKDNVVFMIVDATDGYRETVQKGSEYIAKKGYSFPVYYDTMQEGYFAYNVMSVPATYFIDVEGNIAMKIKGGVDRMTLEQGIAKIYSGQE